MQIYLLMSEQEIAIKDREHLANPLQDPHVYFVGTFANKKVAIEKANEHSEFRGGKYTSYVYKIRVDDYFEVGLTGDQLIYSYNARIDLK